MTNPLITMAAVNGLLAVMLGAFMSHSLDETITTELLGVFQTGVLYHMYHSLAALAAGILSHIYPKVRLLKFSAYSFLLGIVFFSGSLYLLALTELPLIGMITPIGGTFFIFGWIMLCIFGAKKHL
tara:strand:+ start:1348 stop:1725 length:378 start_codon:yes stop_codon:yes gene_type:complete